MSEQSEAVSAFTFDARHGRGVSAGQNFETHRSLDPGFIREGVLGFAVVVLAIVDYVMTGFSLATIGLALLAVVVILAMLRMRIYSVTVQDRVVRLETRMRLFHLLPEDLRGRIHELNLSQLIGLRFASDAELVEVTRKVLDENITGADDIKRLVQDWQADGLRV
jgi:hypothetical protein